MENDFKYFRTNNGGRVHAAPAVDESWILTIWNRYVDSAKYGSVLVDLSETNPAGKAVIKVYVSRRRGNIPRRLKTSRAAHEGRGYLAFARAGIPVVPLLFWGEKRHLALFEAGAVATLHMAADTVSEAFRKTADDKLLHRAAAALGAIHRAGLVHGDPRTRNFLVDGPRLTVIDLPSWSRFSRRSQRNDLMRFLGSAALLTGEIKKTETLLDIYVNKGRPLPVGRRKLLEMADRYRKEMRLP
ncbi:MAG: lipopolysaccharide core heptose(II) kinase RfaY [Thermodesulfobacteriota bacterium]